MAKLQFLRILGFLFWLSLPLMGLLFWLASGWVEDQIINRDYNPKKSLQVDTQVAKQVTSRIVLIDVDINHQKKISLVKVKTNHSALKTMYFEFALSEPDLIEANLSRELGLSPKRVKELIRYRTEDQAH